MNFYSCKMSQKIRTRLNSKMDQAAGKEKVAESNKVIPETDICPNCHKEVEEDDDALTCDVCSFWLHASCEGISKVQFKALEAVITTAGTSWTCSACRRGAKTLQEKLTLLSRNQLEIVEEIKGIKGTQDSMNNRLGKLEEKDSSPTVNQVITEMEERRRREDSVILFNVPESSSTVTEERIQHDSIMFEDFCRDHLKLDTPPIPEKNFRLKSKNGEKPRPMKVRLKSNTIAKEVVDTWIQIPMEERKKIRQFLRRDQTLNQRKERLDLMAERDKRNQEMEARGETGMTWIVTQDNRLRKVNPVS